MSAGGALGAGLRYGVGLLAADLPATVLVNAIGSLLLGLLTALLADRPTGRTWQAFIGIGVLGGFTTFSTVISQVYNSAPQLLTATMILAANLVGGIVCAGFGYVAGTVSRRP